MGKRSLLLGAVGAGARMKLVVNMVMGGWLGAAPGAGALALGGGIGSACGAAGHRLRPLRLLVGARPERCSCRLPCGLPPRWLTSTPAARPLQAP
jgi:hypothetical protein